METTGIAQDEKTINPLVENLINISVLSELLIDEIDQMKDSPVYQQIKGGSIKQSARQLTNGLTLMTKRLYSFGGDDAGAMLADQCRSYSQFFDKVRIMDAKQRIKLYEHINKHYE